MQGLDRFMGGEKPKEAEKKAPAKSRPPHGAGSEEKVDEQRAVDSNEGEPLEEASAYDDLEGDLESEEPYLHEEAPEHEEYMERTIYEAESPPETGTCVLLSVSYSGAKGKALAKLYDVEKGKIYFWYDNTGHEPYCLTDAPLQDLKSNRSIAAHPGFDPKGSREVEKYDLLHDRPVRMTKVAAKDPLSIGGRDDSIRELLRDSWEDRIRYHECYTYDMRLIPGYYYRVKGGDLLRDPPHYKAAPLGELFQKSSPEFMKSLEEWFPLLVSPVPDYRRVAIDIEVMTEAQDRIPDPKAARNPVICVSLAGSDGLKEVLILRREGVEEGARPRELAEDVALKFFDDELDLLKALFVRMLDYPIVMTFNGDNFDLHYLYNRAHVLGMRKEEVPIIMGREIALLPVGVHVDLYKFFHNHAIQIYAFGNAYKEVTLDAIASALLKIRKIPLEKPFAELSYHELANYCFRDSLITLQLTSERHNIAMNLITMIMRISRLSMEDVTRQGVSSWIRSLFFAQHRLENCLIPRREDIDREKGEASTTAIIKGKKYQGAIVIKPQSGVFFNVVVVDFASLYPSIISKWNLSYETVRCPHEECRSNLVPTTPHWVCTRRHGMMSIIIGLLRDVRVKWFKIKSKDPALSEEERNWYKIVQQALKVFLNASYGVFGAEIFPLYCLPLADSTTAIGRYIITQTIEKAKGISIEVLYSDTDSLFLLAPRKDQISQLLNWAESELGIDLEVDKRYTYVAFSGRKKNYLGVMENGVVDIKGLMGKKRNTPPFIKDAFAEMTQVLRDVKTPQDFENAKVMIKEIVQNCYNSLKGRKFPLESLAFKVMLARPTESYRKTTPQHVKAAKQLAEKGKEVKPGDLISFVKVSGPVGVKPVQLARIDEIDVEKYVGHIESTFGQVLEALDIEFDEIVGVKRLEFFSR